VHREDDTLTRFLIPRPPQPKISPRSLSPLEALAINALNLSLVPLYAAKIRRLILHTIPQPSKEGTRTIPPRRAYGNRSMATTPA
jgi:hypothetical protein